MKRILAAAILVAMAFGMPATASAKSKAYNATDDKVEFYWIAAGCAGYKETCGKGYVSLVCKKKKLNPGESSKYGFKTGTSDRQLLAVNCETYAFDWRDTGNKGSKKRCAAIYNDDDRFDLKCGYSSEEYQDLKNGVDFGE
jgi:hypothetical protein